MNNCYKIIEEVTVRVFKPCKKPHRKPDFVSWQGSCYWYGENKRGKYMIRASNHWGKVGDSRYVFSNNATNQCEVGKERVGKTYLTVISFTA